MDSLKPLVPFKGGRSLCLNDPSSAQTLHIQGLAKELDGQYLAAADFYKQAYEIGKDEQMRLGYASSYIQAMAAGGQVVAGWQKSPDKIQAFETLVDLHSEGDIALSQREYRQLVELFRQNYPDNLTGLLQAAAIAFDSEQFSEAERLLKASGAVPGKDDADDYLQTQFNYLLASTLFQQGKLAEAYAVSDDQSQRFVQLITLSTQEDRWDDVRSLLKLHASNEPDDPFLSYVRGELAAHDEHWQEAIDYYLQGLDKAGEGAPWIIKNRLLEVCVESNLWKDYYQKSEDKSQAFYSLATSYVDEQNWDALNLLLYHHRRQQPDDPRLNQIEASFAWGRKDYSAFITRAESALENEDTDTLPGYQRYLLEQRLKSALLRNESYYKAQKQAKAELAEKNDGTSLAIVKAAQGNLRDACDLAIKVAREDESASVFYSNDDVGAIFLKSDFSKLHEQSPVSLAYGNAPPPCRFLL